VENDKLQKFKLSLKSKGIKYLLQNPSEIYLIFPLTLRVFKNRMKKDITEIFLLEMDLGPREYDKSYTYAVGNNANELMQFVKDRINEDETLSGFNYKENIYLRMEKGDKYFILKKNGVIASILFVSYSRTFISPVAYELKIPDGYVGIYDVYTLQEYRGKGLYQNLFNFCVDNLFKDGYRKAYLWLMKHNIPSIVVHNKLGMKTVVKVIIMKQKYGLRWKKVKEVSFNSNNLLKK